MTTESKRYHDRVPDLEERLLKIKQGLTVLDAFSMVDDREKISPEAIHFVQETMNEQLHAIMLGLLTCKAPPANLLRIPCPAQYADAEEGEAA